MKNKLLRLGARADGLGRSNFVIIQLGLTESFLGLTYRNQLVGL